MCLAVFALDIDARFPSVVAANRDEFLARPTAPLGWWSPGPEAPALLAGRDLQAGGTWMGLHGAGRLAFVTNVREPGRQRPDAPSRGQIVPSWLTHGGSAASFAQGGAHDDHNGFNLVALDLRGGSAFWASNRAPRPQPLGPGVHGVSNALLDTPWPKVQALKARTDAAVRSATTADALVALLLDALADRAEAPSATLPDTGIGLQRERQLSPAFIDIPALGYGTRCSTVVVTERTGGRDVTHVIERSFGASDTSVDRRFRLEAWPRA